MGLYTGTNPNLQGVAIERACIGDVPIDLFDVYRHGSLIAGDLTTRQVEQVIARLSAGLRPGTEGREG
jgi:hypothetical protein